MVSIDDEHKAQSRLNRYSDDTDETMDSAIYNSSNKNVHRNSYQQTTRTPFAPVKVNS